MNLDPIHSHTVVICRVTGHQNGLEKHCLETYRSRLVPYDMAGCLKVGNLSWETTGEALCPLSLSEENFGGQLTAVAG